MGQELQVPSTALLRESPEPDRITMIAKAIEECRPDVLNGALVPSADCRAMIAAVDEDQNCRPSPAEAINFARDLLGSFGRIDAHDPDRFVSAIAGVISGFPTSIVALMCHPVNGLPGQSKRAPNSPAEVREWCERVQATRTQLRYKARAILDARQRRERQAREDAIFEQERAGKSQAERAKAAAEILERARKRTQMVNLDD